MSRRYVGARWVLLLLVVTSPLSAASLPEQMACIRDNLPERWVTRMTVRADERDGSRTVQTLVYADRRDPARQRIETAVQLLSPANLQGVAHLYLQRGAQRRQFSFLPAIGKVREVRGGPSSVSIMEGVPGLAELEALWRWPSDAAISVGPVSLVDGRAVQSVRANRRVGQGADVGFERFEGLLDVQTCLVVEGRLMDVQGTLRLGMVVDRRSLQAFGPHWLPRRITISPTTTGGDARITLDAVDTAPAFPSGSFDPDRFYRVGLGVLVRPE